MSDMTVYFTEQTPYARDYEISVWTLQDSYIATLKWSGIEHKGQIQDGQLEINDDGTESLSFKIPMYLYTEQNDSMYKIENPLWYIIEPNQENEMTVVNYPNLYDFDGKINTQFSLMDRDAQGILVKDMRKIKVIFNKTIGTASEKAAAGERVFEFLITKVTHEHESDQTYCSVECEGLAFHELGKQGFKIELSGDVYLDRLDKAEHKKVWYDNNHIAHTEEPEPTLDYWMNDLGIYYQPDQTTINPQQWYYRVEMNYENHSLLPNGQPRSTTKIYEDSYVKSWSDELTPLDASYVEEKKRCIDSDESNIYNLIQTIAETFEVFCRFEYKYDDNYVIVGRTVVFYNNFVKDDMDSSIMELNYPHTTVQISRQYDSTDITTKMFVRPESDDSSLTGEISIIDTEANPTHEDWIMNFDYLHKIGTISDEQYKEIDEYKKDMRLLNHGDITAIAAAVNRGKNVSAIPNNLTVEQLLEDDDEDNINLYSTWQYRGDSIKINDIVIVDNVEYICTAIDSSNSTLTLKLRTDGTIRGITKLQEGLLAKQNRQIEIDSQYTFAKNEYENALDQKNINDDFIDVTGQDIVRDYKNPVTLAVATESDKPTKTVGNDTYRYAYTTLNESLYGLQEDSIELYRTYNNTLQTTTVGNVQLSAAQQSALMLPRRIITTDLSPGYVFNNTIITDAYAEAYVKCCGGDVGTAKSKLQGWLNTLNNFSQGVWVPGTVNSDLLSTDNLFKSDTGSLKDDALAWILFAAGFAKIDYIHNTNFKVYGLKSITLGSKTYNLELKTETTTVKKKKKKETITTYYVTKDSWNELVNVRKAWRMRMYANITSSTILDDINVRTIQPDWNIKGQTIYFKLTENNHIINCHWEFTWNNTTYSASSLPELWSQFATGPNANMDYYTFLQMFGVDMYDNKIYSFKCVRDGNGNIVKISEIYCTDTTHTVYMVCKYNKNTYYKNIRDMWQRKINTAIGQMSEYRNEQIKLKNIINATEQALQAALRLKYNRTEEFNKMMGPALRESYWQPENYHNYGDYYAERLTDFNFNNAEMDAEYNKICAKFMWDSKLFDGEEKSYYESGINRDKVYRNAIDLKLFFANHPTVGGRDTIDVFFDHLDTLCFTFYNDGFDKDIIGSTKRQVYLDPDGEWWYRDTIQHIASDNVNSGQSDKIYAQTGVGGTITQTTKITRSEISRSYYSINSSMHFAFFNYEDEVRPVLLLTGLDDLSEDIVRYILQPVFTGKTDMSNAANPTVMSSLTGGIQNGSSYLYPITPGAQAALGYIDDEGEFVLLGYIKGKSHLDDNNPYNCWFSGISSTPNTYYPRIKINSLQLKTEETTLICTKVDNIYDEKSVLTDVEDYYTFTRDDYYTITIKPEKLFKTWGEDETTEINIMQSYFKSQSIGNPFCIKYAISNGGTYIYVDAVNVLKENSVPKVEYTVTPNIKHNKMSSTLYNYLGAIVRINDYELKLDNAFGYISSIKLHLDAPQEDEIEIKNYKNKFEDLFSSITAETEEMKKNSGLLTALSTGLLTPKLESAVSNKVEDMFEDSSYTTLDAYLASKFDNRAAVMKILNESLEEANTLLSYGTEVTDQLLNSVQASTRTFTSFISNINAQVQPNILYGSPDTTLIGFKIGDILIDRNGERYVAIAPPGSKTPWMQHFKGFTTKLKGAAVDWDAETGIVNIMGEHIINLRSQNVDIMANSTINIFGHDSVNIQGVTVNIFSISDAADVNESAENSLNLYAVRYDSSQSQSFDSNLVPDPTYDYENDGIGISGVFINPHEISMLSSNIVMRGSSSILLQTSLGTADTTSVVNISSESGIFVGTGATDGIRLYALNGANTYFTQAELAEDMAIDYTGQEMSTIELLGNRILFGNTFFNQQNTATTTAVRILKDEFIIASNISRNMKWAQGSSFNTTIGDSEAGLRMTSDSFALSIRNTVNTVDYMQYFKLDKDGIMLSSAEAGQTKPTTSSNGTFVYISPSLFKIGSLGNIDINTSNFKLQTSIIDQGSNTPKTRFSIGVNFNQYQNADEVPSTAAGIVFDGVNLVVGGKIYATSGEFNGILNVGKNGNIYNFMVDSSGNTTMRGSCTISTNLLVGNTNGNYMQYTSGGQLTVKGNITGSIITGSNVTINANSQALIINTTNANQNAIEFNWSNELAGSIAYYTTAERFEHYDTTPGSLDDLINHNMSNQAPTPEYKTVNTHAIDLYVPGVTVTFDSGAVETYSGSHVILYKNYVHITPWLHVDGLVCDGHIYADDEELDIKHISLYKYIWFWADNNAQATPILGISKDGELRFSNEIGSNNKRIWKKVKLE